MTQALNLTEEKVGPCLVSVLVDVDAGRVESAMQAAARRIARETRIPGFRPGKAPYAVVLRTYGRDAVLTEAVDDIGDAVLREIVEQRQINLYDRPALEIVERDPLKLKFTISTRPVVDPGSYRSVRIEPKAAETIDEARVETALEQVRRRHATTTPVERPAQIGDVVRMDVRIADGESVLVDRKSTDVELIEGEEDITPGFSAAMAGIAKDESRTVDLLVPETDTESGLAGKTLNVQVTAYEVKSLSIPPADDELAKTDGRFETVAELRADLRKNLEENAARLAREAYEQDVLEKALDGARIEYPDRMVEREIDHEVEHLREDVAGRGFDFEQWLRMNNLTREALRANVRASAEQKLRTTLFLHEIADKENVQLGPEDVDAYVEEQAQRFPEEMRQMVYDTYKNDDARLGISLVLIQRRAIEKLTSIARGEGVLLLGDAEPARPSEVLIAS